MLLEEWLEKILNGEKTIEIVNKSAGHLVGKKIFLCMSASFKVYGTAIVQSSKLIETASQWDELRPMHCVPGPRMYRDSHAWKLTSVQRITPIPIMRKRGSVRIQKGPGP